MVDHPSIMTAKARYESYTIFLRQIIYTHELAET